jgi:hypothetical protein
MTVVPTLIRAALESPALPQILMALVCIGALAFGALVIVKLLP